MKNNITDYESPETLTITMKYEGTLCISGNHEGTNEEDFDIIEDPILP